MSDPLILGAGHEHSSPQTRQNESCYPGAQQYCSNEDGHASPVMKRRSLALQGYNCHFSSLRRAMIWMTALSRWNLVIAIWDFEIIVTTRFQRRNSISCRPQICSPFFPWKNKKATQGWKLGFFCYFLILKLISWTKVLRFKFLRVSFYRRWNLEIAHTWSYFRNYIKFTEM